MANIKIPETHRKPLRELAAMSTSSRQAFLKAVRAATAVLDPDDLVSRVQSQTKIDAKTVDVIVSMLLTMYRVAGDSRQAFATQVVDAAKLLFDRPQDQNIDWESFRVDLAALLSCDESLGITAKVVDIRREYGRVFCSARILTDIRAVFGTDAARPPLAAAIVHTLRVTYHEGDDHKEFHVALDTADLGQLRELVDRALKKELSLREQVAKTDMRYLAVETEA